jgi:hypothetical protein
MAHEATSALELLNTFDPAVMLIDIALPRLRPTPPRLIAISALAQDTHRTQSPPRLQPAAKDAVHLGIRE